MTRPADWLPQLILSGGFVLAARMFMLAQARPEQLWQRYPALLPGKWQSLQDPRSALLITPTTYQEKYPGFPDSKLTYRITTTCPDPDAPAFKNAFRDVLVTYDAGTATSYCYSIAELTSSRLTLLYFGRGNSLRFKRLK